MASMLAGGLIILVGTALLLDNLGLVQGRALWRWWPLFLVVMGLAKLGVGGSASGRIWGAFLVVVGGFFLSGNLGWTPYSLRRAWPLLIIGLGVVFLLRALERPAAPDAASTASRLNELAIFGGTQRVLNSPEFRGGEAFALFGGVDVDLTRARMAGDHAVIEANALFGGVEIRVPEEWSTSLEGTGLFGGYEDKTVQPRLESSGQAKRLIVRGLALFGGVEVRN